MQRELSERGPRSWGCAALVLLGLLVILIVAVALFVGVSDTEPFRWLRLKFGP
jgi:hypothetical protein